MNFLLGMGSVLALRQLGLIMVMPFIAIYGRDLAYSTPALIGLSLGIYGLSQAVFQIPFGNLSDKFGRKPMILIGMFIFILGLLMSYIATNVYVFILSRFLQGSGAIMAVAYAWVGDRIAGEQRNKAMSIIGMLMGMSATIAFIGGPILYRWMDVPEMFLLCAVLTLIAWLFVAIFIEGDKRTVRSSKIASGKNFKYYAKLIDHNLMKLVIAGFANNYLLVSVFYIVPILLEQSLGVDGLWKVFAPATIISMFVMRIAARYADAGYFRNVAMLAFAAITLGGLGYYTISSYMVGLGLVLFMIGYMCLVTLLPASVTKLSDTSNRGTVTGVFNTVQFIGSFIGGTLTGFLWGVNPIYSVTVLIVVAIVGIIAVSKVVESNSATKSVPAV